MARVSRVDRNRDRQIQEGRRIVIRIRIGSAEGGPGRAAISAANQARAFDADVQRVGGTRIDGEGDDAGVRRVEQVRNRRRDFRPLAGDESRRRA